jgi:hypothetical protein
MFKQLVMILSLVTFFGLLVFAQDNSETMNKEKKECVKGCCSVHSSNTNMSMVYMDMDSTHSSHHDMKSGDTEEVSIVREGEIDLVAIDVNGDGMVYQDPMDWNVIADEPGKCPLCGMKLKEVSLEKAKENLIKNNYEVREN